MAEKQTIQNSIAGSWTQVHAARLMTLRSTWHIDTHEVLRRTREINALKAWGEHQASDTAAVITTSIDVITCCQDVITSVRIVVVVVTFSMGGVAMDQANQSARPQTAFEQLRTWILSGALSPGQRLPVRDVARGLGLSTMPVREALVRLEAAGLVTQERNKGAVVSRMSLDNLNDFYNLRLLLEPPSIQFGVERMTPRRLERVRTTMEMLESAVEANELTTVLDLDEDFLSLIHAAVNNKELARVIRSVWARVRPYKLLFTTTAQSDAGHYMADEDRRLLEAAAAGDSHRAREVMQQSLLNAQVRLADLLRDHEADQDESVGSSVASGESLASAIASLIDRQASRDF